LFLALIVVQPLKCHHEERIERVEREAPKLAARFGQAERRAPPDRRALRFAVSLRAPRSLVASPKVN
jgi:hypothetical protein